MPRRHHVVSRGYLRHFADGEQLRLITKADRTERLAGTRDTFVVKGFNAARSETEEVDALETEWARLESSILPAIRRAIEGRKLKEAEVEIKVLVAVHFARSYFMRELHEAVFAQHLGDPTATMNMAKLDRAFRREFGRPPETDEVEGLVRKHVAGVFESNAMFVERMADVYNTVLNEWLRPLHLQPAWVLRSGPGQLITGDFPVVRTSNGGYRINVPLGEAEMIYMALGPRAGVAFSFEGA
jgi:hypothetical protein